MTNKLINNYYLVTFISELARTIPHPVLVILLLDQKHLSLSEVTFIQIFFYLGVLLFEVPSGYLADRGYRKSGYLAAFLCMLVAYTLIFSFSSVFVLSIAWFIYGIAGALTSGNVDGYIVNLLKQQNREGEIKAFNVKRTNTSLTAGIGGALIGSLLYPLIKTNIYLISIGLYLISILVVIFGIHIAHKPQNVEHLKVTDLKFTSQIKLLITLVCIIELYYVGFYQYWQILYQDKGINPVLFGIIYIIFSFVVIVSNRLYSKLNTINDKVFMPIFIISAFISILFTENILFAIIYPITLFIANLYVIDIYTTLYKVVDESSISSMISIVSSANRLFGIVILGVLAIIIPVVSLNLILCSLYLTFSLLFVVIRNKKAASS